MSLTTDALARLPDALQRPLMVAVLQASVEPLDANDAAALETKQAFDLASDPKSFALDLIGNLIGQPRLQNQSDADYLRAIEGRVVSRPSSDTLPEVKAVTKFLSDTYGSGLFSVQSPEPKTIVIGIGSLTTDPAERDTVVRLLLASIGEVDRFDLLSVPINAFSWGVAGQGWNQGIWVEKVFTTY